MDLSSAQQKLIVNHVKGFSIFTHREILYLEACDFYTIFHLTDHRSVVASHPMKHYEELLKAHTFIRIHRSTIINFHHLKEYRQGDIPLAILNNGKELEIARRRKLTFFKQVKLLVNGC